MKSVREWIGYSLLYNQSATFWFLFNGSFIQMLLLAWADPHRSGKELFGIADTRFLLAVCRLSHPTNSVKALNEQCTTNLLVIFPFSCV